MRSGASAPCIWYNVTRAGCPRSRETMEGLKSIFSSQVYPVRYPKWGRGMLLLIACLLVTALIPLLRELVISFASRIYWLNNGMHKDDPLVDYLIGWAYAFIVWFGIYFWPVSKDHKGLLQKFWILRCLVTLGLMLLYENFYSLDAFEYFNESRYETFRWQVSLSDNWSILAYFAWWVNHNIVLGDSYHAMKVMFSLLGMLGSYLLYLGIAKHMRGGTTWLFMLLQAVPSMLFWSSILGKDPVNFFAICLYGFGVLSLLARKPGESLLGQLLAIVAGITVAFIVRPWTGQILAFPLVIVGLMRIKNLPVRIVALAFVPYLLHDRLGRILASYGVNDATDLLAMVNAVSRSWSRGGSGQAPPVFSNLGDLLYFAPLGMFTALFRPLPGEILNPFGLLAGLENLTMLFFVVWGFKKTFANWGLISRSDRLVLLWVSCTILGWSFLYAFISYQNLGAAFRFRLQIMPMLIVLAIFLNKKPLFQHSLRQDFRGQHDADQGRNKA